MLNHLAKGKPMAYRPPGKTSIEQKAIDEFDEHRLIAELERRKRLREENRCDYCCLPRDSLPPCKMSRRHRGIVE